MTEHDARKRLRKMLHSFTAGRILHMLAELQIEEAKDARRNGDELLHQKLALIEAGLIIVGYGVDVVCPE